MLTDKQINNFWKKWNGWGMVVMWFIIALIAIPIPFIIDYLARVVFKIL